MEDYTSYFLCDEEESYFPESFEELCDNFEYAVQQAELVLSSQGRRGWSFESRLTSLVSEWPAINDALQDYRMAPRVLEMYETLLAGSQTRIRDEQDAEALWYRVSQLVYREPERMHELTQSEDPVVARSATRLLFLSAYDLLDKNDAERLVPLMPAIYEELLATEHPDVRLVKGVTTALSRAFFWSGDDVSGEQSRAVLQAADLFAGNPQTVAIASSMRHTAATSLLRNSNTPPAPEKVAEYIARPDYLVTGILMERLFRKIDFRDASDQDFAAWRDKLAALHMQAQDQGAEAAFLTHLYKEAQYTRDGGLTAQKRIGETVLAYLALDTTALEQGWEHGRGDGRSNHYQPEVYRQMNLECITQIENIEPGATEYLMREHNIRNFNRLPAQIWINQYRNRNDQTRPKEVVLMARSDHSVSLTFGTFGQNVADLNHHAQRHGTDMVVFECETVSDVLRSVFKIAHHYNQRISGIYAAVHGCELGMFFGDKLDGVLLAHGIKRYGPDQQAVRRLQSIFMPTAEGALSSCSTGLPDGPAEALANLLDIPITAPDANSSMIGLNPHATSGGTAFHPLYNRAQPVRHTP